MAEKKSMWVRCPQCARWCYAEKKDVKGRLIRSVKDGDQKLREAGADIAENVGLKGIGKLGGRFINVTNPLSALAHFGEAVSGDNFKFRCGCANEFGTDDESLDMSTEHDLWLKVVDMKNRYKSIKSVPYEERAEYIAELEDLLDSVKNADGIVDAEATLHDLLACCFFYFNNNASAALSEIEKSLSLPVLSDSSLYDTKMSHVLWGIFMGETQTASDNSKKMRELAYLHDISDTHYVERREIEKELEIIEEKYNRSFLELPKNQRKFVFLTDSLTQFPENLKLIRQSEVETTGIRFKDNGSINTMYVCHPHKPNVYYPTETYQQDLFEHQLLELRELLQCLGAKRIRFEESKSDDKNHETNTNLNGGIGGGYKGVDGKLSGSQDNQYQTIKKFINEKLIEEEFSFNPDLKPFVPESELVWFDSMDQWQSLAKRRLRGQDRLRITINTEQTNIINENEALKINAELSSVVAKGDAKFGKSAEVKSSTQLKHQWSLEVEFYPMTGYKITESAEELPSATPQNQQLQQESKVRSNSTIIFLSIIFALLLILAVVVTLLIK